MRETSNCLRSETRLIENFNQFVKGKTITYVNTSATNQTIFHFSDGTMVRMEVEAKGMGLYGPTYYEVK